MRAFSFFESLKSLDVPKPRSTQPTRYRTRVKWVTGPGRAIGLYDAGHKVVDLNDCQVITTAASHHMHTARIHFSKLNPSAIDLRECQTSGSGVTRASAYLLTVVIATSDWPKAKKLATELAASYRTKHREVVGIAVNLRDASSVQMLGPVTSCPSFARTRPIDPLPENRSSIRREVPRGRLPERNSLSTAR